MWYTIRGTLTHVSGSVAPVFMGQIEPRGEGGMIASVQIQLTGAVTPDKIGIRIKDREDQVIPRTGYLGVQAGTISLEDDIPLRGSPNLIKVEGYNSDAATDVTYEIRIRVVPSTLLHSLSVLIDHMRRWMEAVNASMLEGR